MNRSGDYNRTSKDIHGGISSVQIIFSVVAVLLSIVITCGNAIVVIAVCKYRELRSVTNFLIVNLAVTDLIVGVVMLPLHAVIFIEDDLRRIFAVCALRYGLFILTVGASSVLLVFISLDRFIAITMVLKYPRIITRRRVTTVIIIMWIYGVFIAFLPSLGPGSRPWSGNDTCDLFTYYNDEYILFLQLHCLANVIVFLCLYAHIFCVVQRKLRKWRRSVNAVSSRSVDHLRQNRFSTNVRSIKTVGLIVGVFIVCISPNIVVTFISMRYKSNIPSEVQIARTASSLLMLINSALNPFIYHRRNVRFRKIFRKMLPFSCECKKRVEKTNNAISMIMR